MVYTNKLPAILLLHIIALRDILKSIFYSACRRYHLYKISLSWTLCLFGFFAVKFPWKLNKNIKTLPCISILVFSNRRYWDVCFGWYYCVDHCRKYIIFGSHRYTVIIRLSVFYLEEGVFGILKLLCDL